MVVQLGNIANIGTGVFAQPGSLGNVIYLQLSHFNLHGDLKRIAFPDLPMEHRLEKHLLHGSEVLFAAKGSRNFAWAYKPSTGKAVASSAFFVIRLVQEFHSQALPAYLAWYINQPWSQLYFGGIAKGTALHSISKSSLEALEIALPPMSKQNTIIHFSKLKKRELDLKNRIEQLQSTKIQKLLYQAIHD